MPPDQLQTQTPAATPSLDPSVVNLTKAIGQAESGGVYNKPSPDKGSPPSAYQFTPSFIQQYAPKYLGQYDPNNLSPDQQDKLAYSVVNEWGTQDKLTPAEIASKWNTGDSKAYLDPEYGQNNSYGSTTNYVDKIRQNYEQLNGGQTQTNQPSPAASDTSGSTDTSIPTSAKIAGGVGLGALGLAAWLAGPEVGIPVDAALASEAGAAAVGSAANDAVLANGGPIASEGGGILSKIMTGLGYGSLEQGAVSGIKGLFGGSSSSSAGGGGSSSQSTDPAIAAMMAEIPQAHQASSQLAQNLTQMVGNTASGASSLQDPNVQKQIQTLAEYGYQPQTGGVQALDQHLQTLAEGEKEMARANGGSGSTLDAQKIATEQINNNHTLNPVQKQQAHAVVAKQVAGYGKSLKLEDMVDARHQQYASTKGKYGHIDSATIEAHKALGRGFKETITKNMKHPELHKAVTAEQSKIINARKLAKTLEKRKIPMSAKHGGIMHTIGRSLVKYGADYLGAKLGGPFGAIVADIVGGKIMGKVDKHYAKTIFESAAGKKILDKVHEQSPNAYKALMIRLHQEGAVPTNADVEKQGEQTLIKNVQDYTKSTYPKPKILNKKQMLSAARKTVDSKTNQNQNNQSGNSGSYVNYKKKG